MRPRWITSKVPANTKHARDLAACTDSYSNSYYGPLVVTAGRRPPIDNHGATMAPTSFDLTHFDGDTFSFETIGENANGLAAAIFMIADDGKASKAVLDYYDRTDGRVTMRRMT